jgi:hypothetical protein
MAKMQGKRRQADRLRPGDKVIIRQNSHDPRAEGIVGTVMVYRAGAGFGGCDLLDVHYKRPSDGQGSTLPFGLCCLDAATPAELIRLAEHHERLAAGLRSLADTLGRSG